MNIGEAIGCLQTGGRISRKGWNGPGQYLEIKEPDDTSDMTLPYIYIRTVQGDFVPWLASQTDILSDDWVSVI